MKREMIHKQVPFKREKIAICRNCFGLGHVQGGFPPLGRTTCHVCNGSGRVKLIYQGTVTVEHYTEPATDGDPYEGCYP
mgnify:CR=1 FL=1